MSITPNNLPTNLTIAANLIQWMMDNKTPFPADMPLQPGDTNMANDVVSNGFDWDIDPHFIDMPGQDWRNSTSSAWPNPSQLIGIHVIGGTVVGMEFLLLEGVQWSAITAAINADNYLVLDTLYPNPAGMWADMVAAAHQVSAQLAPTNTPFRADFFGNLGVVYPAIKTPSEQAVDACAAAWGFTPTAQQYQAAVAAINALWTVAPC